MYKSLTHYPVHPTERKNEPSRDPHRISDKKTVGINRTRNNQPREMGSKRSRRKTKEFNWTWRFLRRSNSVSFFQTGQKGKPPHSKIKWYNQTMTGVVDNSDSTFLSWYGCDGGTTLPWLRLLGLLWRPSLQSPQVRKPSPQVQRKKRPLRYWLAQLRRI